MQRTHIVISQGTESRKHTTCDALATVVSAAADSTDSTDAADSAVSANATTAGAGAGAGGAAAAAAAAGAAGAADEWGDVMSEVSQQQQGDDLPSEQGDEPTINE